MESVVIERASFSLLETPTVEILLAEIKRVSRSSAYRLEGRAENFYIPATFQHDCVSE